MDSLFPRWLTISDIVYAEGYADSYVDRGVAMAMAQSKSGEAAVWTDGKNHRFHSTGSGMCMAGQGWAVAMVDQNNKAAAYSHQAYKNSQGLPSASNRYMIANGSNNSYKSYNGKSSRCCDGTDGCYCSDSCRCSCSACVCS